MVGNLLTHPVVIISMKKIACGSISWGKRNLRAIEKKNSKTNGFKIKFKNIVKMEKIIINIGASSDHFGAYAENCDGIYGAGNTVEEAKENALEGLRLLISSRKKEELPEILQGEYEIAYQFDTHSLSQRYENIFNKPALEKLTGINQKQLHHYEKTTTKKQVVHCIDLMSVEL